MIQTKKTPNAERSTPNGGNTDRHNGISKAGTKISSREDFEALLKNIVEAQLDRELLEGRRDAKIIKIQSEFSAEIEALGEEVEEGVARAETYAIAHRNQLLPADSKSAETCVATFGFRIGKPALALLEDWDWDKCVAAIKKKFAPLVSLLIVTKETPDKNNIKKHLGDKELARIGCQLDQTDKFFIEPKRDPADPRRLIAQKA